MVIVDEGEERGEKRRRRRKKRRGRTTSTTTFSPLHVHKTQAVIKTQKQTLKEQP